jgi:Tfp pilus assembly PilM family ATPase
MSFTNTIKKIGDRLLLAFPTPKYLSLGPAGLDITSNSIRVMKLKKTPAGFVPSLYKEVKFQSTRDLTVASPDQKDIDSVIQVLKKLRKELRLKYVTISLPEQKNYIYRTLQPYEAIHDIPSAIRFSMEENVPFPVNEVNFDYHVVSVNKKTIDVVVSVFPKSVINFYTELLNQAGLKPLAFESESVALSSAIVNKDDKDLYLLVRLLDDRINVSIYESGAVQYTSSISVSGKEVAADLEGPAAKTMIQELNKIMIFWFTDKKESQENHKIEKAIIVGKYANAEGAEEILENGLKIDVQMGEVWTNCFSQNDYVPELSSDDSMEYAVAIGLALKAVKYK